MNMADLRITMTFKNSDDNTLIVEYNPYSWIHDCFDQDGFLGRIPLKELFFSKYKCVKKVFNY